MKMNKTTMWQRALRENNICHQSHPSMHQV